MSTASALLDAYLPAFLSLTTLPLPTFLARVYPLALGAFLVIVSLGLFFAPARMANGVKMAPPSPQTRGYMLLFAIREFSMGALFVAITLQGRVESPRSCECQPRLAIPAASLDPRGHQWIQIQPKSTVTKRNYLCARGWRCPLV
jgi:hypothetical protein